MFKKRNKKRKGFSLIELIVVIGILAVLTVVAVANYGNLTTQARNASLHADATIISRSLNIYNAMSPSDITTLAADGSDASAGSIPLVLSAADIGITGGLDMSVQISQTRLVELLGTGSGGPWLTYAAATGWVAKAA